MSMFGRRKNRSDEPADAGPPSASRGAPDTSEGGPAAAASPAGPHDRSELDDLDAHFRERQMGYMDLGALVIAIPPERELNVALDPAGSPEFHLVSQHARVIPHAYAAPKSAGQWRSWITEMSTGLEAQGAEVQIVDGPWGREVRAELPGAVFRAIGCDGPRWMAEVRVMSTPEVEDIAAEEGREVLRNLVISRGNDPMPAREHLPLAVPDEVTQALAAAQNQAAEQARAQAMAEQMAAAELQARGPQGPAGSGPAAPDGTSAAPRRDGSAMDSLRDDEF